MEMTLRLHTNGRFTWKYREWTCCGHVWQLLLSRQFPERFDWRPTCPDCGAVGQLKEEE